MSATVLQPLPVGQPSSRRCSRPSSSAGAQALRRRGCGPAAAQDVAPVWRSASGISNRRRTGLWRDAPLVDHNRRPLPLRLEVVTAAALKSRQPRCSAVREPSAGLEPSIPSLPWQSGSSSRCAPERRSACTGWFPACCKRPQESAGSGSFWYRVGTLASRLDAARRRPTDPPSRSGATAAWPALWSVLSRGHRAGSRDCRPARGASRRASAESEDSPLRVSRAPAAGSARGRSRSARPGSQDGPSPHGRRSRRPSRRGRRGSAG
jgi:hypothetical protein